MGPSTSSHWMLMPHLGVRAGRSGLPANPAARLSMKTAKINERLTIQASRNETDHCPIPHARLLAPFAFAPTASSHNDLSMAQRDAECGIRTAAAPHVCNILGILGAWMTDPSNPESICKQLRRRATCVPCATSMGLGVSAQASPKCRQNQGGSTDALLDLLEQHSRAHACETIADSDASSRQASAEDAALLRSGRDQGSRSHADPRLQ